MVYGYCAVQHPSCRVSGWDRTESRDGGRAFLWTLPEAG